MHQLHRLVGSLLSQHVGDLAELERHLKLLPPHAAQRGLKLAQLILCVEANQPHPLISVVIAVRLKIQKETVCVILENFMEY